jgi:hypothetical protein
LSRGYFNHFSKVQKGSGRQGSDRQGSDREWGNLYSKKYLLNKKMSKEGILAH